MAHPSRELVCEQCGQKCNDEFGDVGGAIICPDCLGWYGIDSEEEVCEFCNEPLDDCQCAGVAYEPDDSAEQWPPSWETER